VIGITTTLGGPFSKAPLGSRSGPRNPMTPMTHLEPSWNRWSSAPAAELHLFQLGSKWVIRFSLPPADYREEPWRRWPSSLTLHAHTHTSMRMQNTLGSRRHAFGCSPSFECARELFGCFLSFTCALCLFYHSIMLFVLRLCLCEHYFAVSHSVALGCFLSFDCVQLCSLFFDCARELVGCSLSLPFIYFHSIMLFVLHCVLVWVAILDQDG
jgi:hypothetical protein